MKIDVERDQQKRSGERTDIILTLRQISLKRLAERHHNTDDYMYIQFPGFSDMTEKSSQSNF